MELVWNDIIKKLTFPWTFIYSKPSLATSVQAAVGTLDYVVDTISAKHDLEQYLSLLKVDGKYVVVGVPPEPYQLNAGTLIFGKCSPKSVY